MQPATSICQSLRIPLHLRRFGWLFAAFALFMLMGRAGATSVPTGFTDKQVASGLTSPTSMTVLPDGRVLVVQQNGEIKLIKGDVAASTDFYIAKNIDSFAERGCLGIVADPAFATNHYLYLYCTVTTGAESHNRVFRITEANDMALPGSETTILDLPSIPAGTQWHMGGALRFGADGKLYIAVGGQEDLIEPAATSNSQNLVNPFGKILRINADGSVPPDNPFYNKPSAYQAIFAFGFRNPFSFDIQPGTGLIYINDVGAGSWEEIDQGVAGANYGWPAAEGYSNNPIYTNPIFAYPHEGGACAITGGAFYDPPQTQFPAAYVGKYFYGDFCTGIIHMLDPANPVAPQVFASGIGNPVNIGVAYDGSLYYLARNQNTGVSAAVGTVGKISFTNTQLPQITLSPQSQTIHLGDPATFTTAADGASAYQWQRNGVDIPGATSTSYTLPATTMADNQAVFTVRVANGYGSVVSSPAVLTVTSNNFPVATITSPLPDSGFVPNQVISYAGTATDAEDGALPPSAFTWRVDFMHDKHSHPFIPELTGKSSGTFTISNFEAEQADTWLRLFLTVQDSGGLRRVVTRDIFPRQQLSDLTPIGTPLNGNGPIELNMSSGGPAAGDGGKISLGGIPYPKGIGVAAPSDVRYDLAGLCSGSLIADVGIDDEVGKQGSVVFQVWLDGQKAFDSGLMRGGDARKAIELSVAGKKELRLVVTDAGDGNAFDHADWGGPRVTGCPTPMPGATSDTASAAGGSTSSSGGGGCSIGGDGRFDPTLPASLLAALGMVAWRRRRDRLRGTAA